MFKDKECIKLADEIYVFKNYIPKDMCDRYVALLDSYPIESFKEDNETQAWYRDRMSPDILELIDIWEHVSELIYPEYYINPQTQIIASRPGQEGMFVHCDSPGKGMVDMLTQVDTYSTCSLIDYGVVAYLSEFEGGDVFYPNLGISYKPEAGDVIIHSAFTPYEHGTMPVLSGVRYAFSCFATSKNELPGTFYPYKSKEYLEYVKDRSLESLLKWSQPIN
jgi:hypothetical protein